MTASVTRDTLAALRRGDLAGARELDFSRCGLTELPQELFALSDTLEVLDIGFNRLTDLPARTSELRALRVMFASGNRFSVLPPVLGELPTLSQLGVRGVGLRELPAEALPPAIRWLTLTDNRLEHLPEALGWRPRLQKLMLAGNRLTDLPASLAGAARLELLRLSANPLQGLPGWLAELPSLAWLAWAGAAFEPDLSEAGVVVSWGDLQLRETLGEGASGHVRRAEWRRPGGQSEPVAVKLFKGAVTSDGLPEHEMGASLLAGEHPNLAGAIGRTAHGDVQGLVLRLVPEGWGVLAGPPSRESCSRDVYDAQLRLSAEVVLRLGGGIAAAAAHLHGRGLMHGDLYAHNVLWDRLRGDAVLSDFGAASRLPPDADHWTRLETLAWGRLWGELLDRCDSAPERWRNLQASATAPHPRDRPSMRDVAAALHHS